MKIKNTSTRNINVLAPHNKAGGEINHISILAGSTIELTKAEMKPMLEPFQRLFDAGVLVEAVEAKPITLDVEPEAKTPAKK